MRKFLLTTKADNCFKLLSICPDCTLQVLTLFVAQISTPMLLYCALHWLCSIPSETTGSLQISYENIRSLMLLHVIEAWKPLQVTIVNLHIFSKKKNARTKSIKNPYYKLLFRFLLGSHWLTKLDCYNLLLHNVTEDYKDIGSQRVCSGPQGLAFCSGNSDRDGFNMILGEWKLNDYVSPV